MQDDQEGADQRLESIHKRLARQRWQRFVRNFKNVAQVVLVMIKIFNEILELTNGLSVLPLLAA